MKSWIYVVNIGKMLTFSTLICVGS